MKRGGWHSAQKKSLMQSLLRLTAGDDENDDDDVGVDNIVNLDGGWSVKFSYFSSKSNSPLYTSTVPSVLQTANL